MAPIPILIEDGEVSLVDLIIMARVALYTCTTMSLTIVSLRKET